MLKILVGLTYFINVGLSQIIHEDDKSCYYCGITDICEMPYDTDEAKYISCEKSCLKFDGNAKDGKRVVIRTCGYFTYCDQIIHFD